MNIATIIAWLSSFSLAAAFSGLDVVRSSRSSATALNAEESTMKGAEALSALTKDTSTFLTSQEIDELLPHRFPIALVDKVLEYDAEEKRAVGVKSVTKNEDHFNGHFPGNPVMPGVLQVEALAQLAGIILMQMEGTQPGQPFLFGGVDGVKWKKPVVPGDSLVMEAKIKKFNAKFGLAKAEGKAYVDGQIAVEVKDMTFALLKE